MQFHTTYPIANPADASTSLSNSPHAHYFYLSSYAPIPHMNALSDPQALSDSYDVNPFDLSKGDLQDSITTTTGAASAPGNTMDPLDSFLTGKSRFLKKTAQELISLIYERERIRYDHAKRIDYESCRVGSRLLDIAAWRTGVDPGIDKTRSQLEREIIGFEREKRMEEIACWRDIVRIKAELRESLRDLDHETRRDDLVKGRNTP